MFRVSTKVNTSFFRVRANRNPRARDHARAQVECNEKESYWLILARALFLHCCVTKVTVRLQKVVCFTCVFAKRTVHC